MTLSRALIEERAQKDLAIQQAVATVRADLQVQEKGDVVTVVQCDKVTYRETWDENNTENQQTIELLEVEADSDKEKDWCCHGDHLGQGHTSPIFSLLVFIQQFLHFTTMFIDELCASLFRRDEKVACSRYLILVIS